MTPSDQALVHIGHHLKALGYRFTTPTPLTHARVNAREANRIGTELQDIFGWNRLFARASLQPDVLRALTAANAVEEHGNLLRSKVRFSSLGDLLLMHSQFPTSAADSVFFGPDTYRFARAIRAVLAQDKTWQPRTIIDVGCGTGAGGFYARSQLGNARDARLVLGDINDSALRFAAVNAGINAQSGVEIVKSDVLAAMTEADLIVSNPPYLVDPAGRVYRNGGGTFGCDLSCRIVEESIAKLTPRGKLLLYTGAPVVGGHDKFYEAVLPILKDARCAYTYEEIDPDVFGEELEEPSYQTADRIAVVALIVDKGKSHAS